MKTLFAILIALAALLIQAHAVTLAWDASTDTSVTGYKLKYGTASGTYTTTVTLGLVTTVTVANSTLPANTPLFAAVVAVNAAGLESLPSNEVTWTYVPDTSLASLTTTVGTLSPAFSPAVVAYAVTVPAGTSLTSFTPTCASGATMTVNGVACISGASASVALSGTATTVSIIVTNAGVTKTYQIDVKKRPSTVANLRVLSQ